MQVSARFALNTTYYSLSAERFANIAQSYSSLRKAYNNVYSQALAARDRNDNSLDYLPGRDLFESDYSKTLDEKQLDRANTTLRNFKNSVMYYIAENRKDRKIPKLKDVLEKVIAKQAAEKKAKREKMKNITIESLKEDDRFLSDEQYSNLKG